MGAFSYAFESNADIQVAHLMSSDHKAIALRTRIWWGDKTWSAWKLLDAYNENREGNVITYSSYVTSHTIQLERRGQTVFVGGYFNLSANTPVDTMLFTLPSGFRPIAEWTAIAQVPTGSNANSARVLVIKTNGEAQLHNGDPMSGFLRFSVAFPCISK